jgi:hypothetical protein
VFSFATSLKCCDAIGNKELLLSSSLKRGDAIVFSFAASLKRGGALVLFFAASLIRGDAIENRRYCSFPASHRLIDRLHLSSRHQHIIATQRKKITQTFFGKKHFSSRHWPSK